MSSKSSDLDIDLKVEILKKKYLEKRNGVSDTVKPSVSATTLEAGHSGAKSAKHDTIPRKEEDPEKISRYGEIKHYSKALKELLQAVSSHPQSDSISGSEDELSDQTNSFEGTRIPCSETDVTLPSNLVCTSNSSVTEPVWLVRREELRDQTQRLTASPAAVAQVFQEMLEIYEKLQMERLSQQAWAAGLREQEHQLQQREARLLQHHSTICRLRGVEGEVIGRVHTLQQQYQQQIETLRTALKEKTKENKRIKSSFGSIKELNYTMKKQLDDVTEQNRRLENQSRKVQARLDNLQRKYEYSVAHKRRENVVPKSCDPNPPKQDRPLPSSKASKVLPVLVQQLQQTARTEASLQLPLLRFTYYCLSQLEHSTQHPPLTSTLRRLGEEVSCGQGGGDRSRSHPLFKSSCLHTRFLSSLIVLRTVSLVGIVTQATDVLHDDVGMEDGKAFFLKYQALAVILAVLRAGNPSLQVRAMDILLQMGAESRYLPSFLQACSTEQFFRWASTFLRSTRLDLTLAEKLSILLQKLSGIRKNKRLFEAFSLHLLLQEMHRTTNPAHAFLTINLSSILLNLGMPTRP
ncbi:coiled-coil domain-containing protein 138 isoform X2 [Electrophorus electricus]|uniref:coiled-coil domain-containing protein 138 isoform X2 n=1 Tax=Electrophorus electricus TaxID=8005 RepID=UPI0015D02477|nr:coiled-coil domain-containing protein 138 isoform X2 [Electrophorus electricus]